jgi:hypothetical protein
MAKLIDVILKVIIAILLLMIIGFLCYCIYNSVLEPAYMSYAGVCVIDFNTSDYGYTTLAQTDTTTGEVEYYVNEYAPIMYTITKHENIHVNQVNRGIKFTCNNLYFLEIEAYLGQYLPDRIYYTLY